MQIMEVWAKIRTVDLSSIFFRAAFIPSMVTSVVTILGLGVSANAQAQSIGDVAANVAGCAVIGEARASMPVDPLFQRDDGECVALNPRGSSILDSLSWFEDENCSTRVGFVPTPLVAFCAQIADETVLGTADDIVPSTWTLTPGSRVNIGALSLTDVPQPYMQRIRYASIPTSSGQCELEMRVYKSHPGATGLRSMVALHGGSWRFRGLGYFGLEITIPHLVSQGFVVYAPFYRLLDDVDGSVACQNAEISDLVSDAQTALNWVQANDARYGSSGKPVVFGQSAGAHLAGSLWLNRRDEISGAVLLYPPTDFTDFTARVQSGEYTNEDGIDILELVLGTDANEADVATSFIEDNSYPQRVAAQPDGLAPVMMLHGQSDELVEDRQSIRLCNALAGRAISSEVETADQDLDQAIEGLRTVVSCEPENSTANVSSTLHLFNQGRHAMDICIEGQFLAEQTCPSGSNESADAIGESIEVAAIFAQQAFDAALEVNDDSNANDELDSESGDSADTNDTNDNGDTGDSTGDGTDQDEPMTSESSSSSGGFFGSMSLFVLSLLMGSVFIRCYLITRNAQ